MAYRTNAARVVALAAPIMSYHVVGAVLLGAVCFGREVERLLATHTAIHAPQHATHTATKQIGAQMHAMNATTMASVPASMIAIQNLFRNSRAQSPVH